MIYAKPFVNAPKAFVGGYFDLQYRNHRKDVIDNGAGSPGSNPGIGSTNSSFDQKRFVPFIYADITDQVKFASELEIEHGIREGTETEVSLEFAHVDYLFSEPVNLRAGIILLLRVEGTVQHPERGGDWEYSVVLAIRNERGEEISRQVVGVGALRPSDSRTFTLSVFVMAPAGRSRWMSVS